MIASYLLVEQRIEFHWLQLRLVRRRHQIIALSGSTKKLDRGGADNLPAG